MTWAFVRPADPTVLEPRPLLDLGTGDGTTRKALAGDGLVIGIDRTFLRGVDALAVASALPFADGSFATVLAADLFHHIPDELLPLVITEITRVLRGSGRLVAWWYEHTSDTSPDAPRHARSFEELAAFVRTSFDVAPLDLKFEVEGSATVGVLGQLRSRP